jgi:putative oxidoreductase
MRRLLTAHGRALAALKSISWLGPLLVRLSVGAVFLGTGWGKLHSLPSVTSYFQELGIPAPAFHALLASTTEFLGGVALIAGVATRLACAPLAVTMIVAILTAKRGDIVGLRSLLSFEEFTYLAVFVWLAIAGPGAASVDALLLKGAAKVAEERGEQGLPRAREA